MPRAKAIKSVKKTAQVQVEASKSLQNSEGETEISSIKSLNNDAGVGGAEAPEASVAAAAAKGRVRGKKLVEPVIVESVITAGTGRGRKKQVVEVTAARGNGEVIVTDLEEVALKAKRGRTKQVATKQQTTELTPAEVIAEPSEELPKEKKRGKKAKSADASPQKPDEKTGAEAKKNTGSAANKKQTAKATSTTATGGKGRKNKEIPLTEVPVQPDTEIEDIIPIPNEEEKTVPPKKRAYGKRLKIEPETLNGEKEDKPDVATKSSPKKAKIEKVLEKPKKEIKSKGKKQSKINEEIKQEEEKPVVSRGLKRNAKSKTVDAEDKTGDLINTKIISGEIKTDVDEVSAKKKRGAKIVKEKKSEDIKAENTEENIEVKEKRKATNRERKRLVTTAEDKNDGSEAKPSKSRKTAPLNNTETSYNKADFELAPLKDADNTEDKRFNLKISSWNVSGLRSWLKKDGLKFLDYEEPDIFCLQEIKCTPDQLPEEAARIPGYHPYWLCKPGGYAGVAIYSKIMPIHVEYGIGDEEFDEVGRVITAEYEKFFLVCIYVPNSGRKLVNLEARMRWEKLFQAFVQELDARKAVIIAGDMNVSHEEIDLANPKTNTRNAGFTKEEREKMTELLALGYVDTFRHLYPSRTGAYTFWTYIGNARARNVGWRLDYFLVSQRLIKRVVESCIRSQCKGSDHCPITLFLNL